MKTHPLSSSCLLVLLAVLAGGCAIPQTGAKRGAVLYDACTACHGADGSGNAELRVPRVAGLPEWYLRKQLTNFDRGLRAYHVDDYDGLRMRPMLLTLQENGSDGARDEIGTASNIAAVSDYIARMPVVEPEATLEHGDSTRGQIAYALCSACHGVAGLGNEVLGSPPLVNLDDWYIVNSLKKFKSRQRGAHPDDAVGATMQAISLAVPTEEAMEDLAAYIQTL
jgi:cytochrome c553